MTVRLEGLSPDGRRVHLALEDTTLVSLCMSVGLDAPVFVVAEPLAEREAWRWWYDLTKCCGYRNVTVEIKEP